ncbi:MAG TPA: SRPBCC domain-containing protein [Kofleriaceae bacterium]
MTASLAADAASVTMFVGVDPADAFEVFTTDIDQWWRRGPRFRAGAGASTLHLEPRLGGRFYELYAPRQAADALARHELGEVLAWDPPGHLAFEWRATNFVAGETTRVDIFFTASGAGTSVRLIHSGWAALRGDHPVRHGQPTGPFLAGRGMWWTDLLRALAARLTGD